MVSYILFCAYRLSSAKRQIGNLQGWREAQSLPPGVVLRAANQNSNDCRGQSYLNFQLSRVAKLMRNGDTDRLCIRFVKKAQLETLYVLSYRRSTSESVAIPHPPLRGTFPPGEGISPPNSQFVFLLSKADKHILFYILNNTALPCQ